MWTPRPQNKPQQLAFASDADVIGYGGQAGGGKTDLLIGESVTRHHKSVIFRREAKQLRDIIERSKQVIGSNGSFNETSLIWRGLPGGRTLELGGVKDDDDIEKWRGRAHDLKAFDEAPEFSERQIRFLMGWNRSTIPQQKSQSILAFNPPRTPEGRWIIEFFAAWLDPQHPYPAKDGELRWYARLDDKDVARANGEPFEHNGEIIKPRSRTFIRATLRDNPDLADTDYEANLQFLPEPLRSQLLYGDFQAGIKDDEWQVIPTDWVKRAQDRWRKDAGRFLDDGKAIAMTALGVDVARGGDDNSVLAARYDAWFDELIALPGKATPNGPQLVKEIINLLLQRGDVTPALPAREIEYADYFLTLPVVSGGPPVNIDVIGVGSSVYDVARAHGLTARAVNVSEASKGRDRSGKLGFVNKRAEFHWRLREALDPVHGENIALPPDPVLLADLTAARYSIQANGIKVEAKDDIKKRIGRSPDRGEAVMLAMAQTRLQIFLGGNS